MGGLLLFSAKLVDFQAPNHFQSVDFSNRWAPPGTKLSETIQYAALAVGSDRCDAQGAIQGDVMKEVNHQTLGT